MNQAEKETMKNVYLIHKIMTEVVIMLEICIITQKVNSKLNGNEYFLFFK